jgi:hypothetical protein
MTASMDTRNIRDQRIKEVEAQLSALDGEPKRPVAELAGLQSSTCAPDELPPVMGLPSLPGPPQTPDKKVELFLSLFRARESVFPRRWENAARGGSKA